MTVTKGKSIEEVLGALFSFLFLGWFFFLDIDEKYKGVFQSLQL